MTDEELRQISDSWEQWATIGNMPDGAAIKVVPGIGWAVREPSGYFCSPIAYSCRGSMQRKYFTPSWVRGLKNLPPRLPH